MPIRAAESTEPDVIEAVVMAPRPPAHRPSADRRRRTTMHMDQLAVDNAEAASINAAKIRVCVRKRPLSKRELRHGV